MSKTEAYFLSLLPEAVRALIRREKEQKNGTLTEIHLRASARASLVFRCEGETKNIPLPISLSEGELREVLSRVCGGSIYAFEESLREGFVTLPSGVRVGVGGKASVRGGAAALSGVRSLCFRIPHAVSGCADALAAFFREKRQGILLFAPPSGGKTTLLRELARDLSRGEKAVRCAVIDTRGELCGFEEECLIHRLSGYDKAKGAEIAVRTLSPELLLMDELGNEDVRSLLSLVSFGVPVIATAHGREQAEIEKSALRPLFEAGIFSYLWDVKAGAPLPLRRKDRL